MDGYDVLIVGSDFHACYLAVQIAEQGQRVLLVEPSSELLDLAHSSLERFPLDLSCLYSAQSPRQSRHNFRRFLDEFHNCLDRDLPHYVAMTRASSKTSASQLHAYCLDLDVNVEVAPEAVRRAFDADQIETVFRIDVGNVNLRRLRERMLDRLDGAGVEIRTDTGVQSIRSAGKDRQSVWLTEDVVSARETFVFHAETLDQLQRRDVLESTVVRRELHEDVIVRVPQSLQSLGLTILNGPMVTLIPRSESQDHVMRQSRFLRNAAWIDLGPMGLSLAEILERKKHQSNFETMRRELSRTMPILGDLRHQRSNWRVKSIPMDTSESWSTVESARINVRGVVGTRWENVYEMVSNLTVPMAKASRLAA